MLGLNVDAHALAVHRARAVGQLQDLVQSGHLILTVQLCVGRTDLRQPLTRTKRLQFSESEVLGEPAGHLEVIDDLGGPSSDELVVIGHVSGPTDLVLVLRHEDTVSGRHEVSLDVIGALLDRQRVAGKRVLGIITARPPVSYHQGRPRHSNPGRHLPSP